MHCDIVQICFLAFCDDVYKCLCLDTVMLLQNFRLRLIGVKKCCCDEGRTVCNAKRLHSFVFAVLSSENESVCRFRVELLFSTEQC